MIDISASSFWFSNTKILEKFRWRHPQWARRWHMKNSFSNERLGNGNSTKCIHLPWNIMHKWENNYTDWADFWNGAILCHSNHDTLCYKGVRVIQKSGRSPCFLLPFSGLFITSHFNATVVDCRWQWTLDFVNSTCMIVAATDGGDY